MLLKKVLSVRVQKFIYILLIFSIGVIGSLTDFDLFTPRYDRGYHPHSLNGLEEQVHINNSLSLPLEPDFPAFFTTVYPIIALEGACFCHLCSSHTYSLTASINLFSDIPLSHHISATNVTTYSAWLSPLDKPPQPYLS